MDVALSGSRGPAQLFIRCAGILSGLLLLALLPIPATQAGDEEFNPSVYQIFDPVTGYFIDVEQPADNQQAATQNPAVTTPAEQTTATGTSASVAAQQAPVEQPANSTLPRLTLAAAGAVALVLVAGFAFRRRKGEHKQNI